MEIFEVNPRLLEQVNATELSVKQKLQHEFKMIGSQRRRPGLTMWCVNLKTGEIKAAPVKRECVFNIQLRQPEYKTRIVVEPHCLYRQCLNKKSFIKRLIREGVIIQRVPKESDVIAR
jgi:hypothetical protein